MSTRTRPPQSDSDFTWEEPYDSSARRRRPPTRRPPRRVALPVVGIALVLGLLIGFMAGGSGGSTTVTETMTVTTEAAPTAPAAAGPEARAGISLAILNGSGESGLAGRTGEVVRGLGYTRVTEGNAPALVAADRVLYRPGSEEQALQVAADLGASAPIPLDEASGIAGAAPDADVVAVMGPSDASNLDGAGAAPAPSGAAPDAGAVQPAQGSAPEGAEAAGQE